MGVRVCKPVCIEEKISGREVADYVASKERNATPNSCDQQPLVHLFSPLYTRTYIHEPPFRHSAPGLEEALVVNNTDMLNVDGSQIFLREGQNSMEVFILGAD